MLRRIPAQILAQLQTIAAQQELRFEVNRSTALVFQARSCLDAWTISVMSLLQSRINRGSALSANARSMDCLCIESQFLSSNDDVMTLLN